jgi:peptidoglycan hydrolase-like protein with peptidoglycan-binding domain
MVSMRSFAVASLAAAVVASSGFSAAADNELKGGILGGAAGAGLGAVLGGAKGAAVGGVLGLGVGALGANQLSKPKQQAAPPPPPTAAYPAPPPAAYPAPPPGQVSVQPAAYPPAPPPQAAPPTQYQPQYAPAQSQRDITLGVQNELVALGYNPGSVDGISGRQTQEAIRAYQYQHGLPVDGVVTQKLLDHLRITRAAAAQQQPATYQPGQTGTTYSAVSGGQASVAGAGATAAPGSAATAGQAAPLASIDQSNCRPYQQVVNIEGQQQMVTSGTACLQPDGTWRIVQ